MNNDNKKRGRPKKIKNYDSPFAARLRELSGDSTHQEIAEGVGVSRQTIGQFLLGNTQPDLETLDKLADYFDVSTDYLLCRTNIRTPNTSVKEICKYTGLDESAILKLNSYKERFDSDITAPIISELIVNNHFIELILKLWEIEEGKKEQVYFDKIKEALYNISTSYYGMTIKSEILKTIGNCFSLNTSLILEDRDFFRDNPGLEDEAISALPISRNIKLFGRELKERAELEEYQCIKRFISIISEISETENTKLNTYIESTNNLLFDLDYDGKIFDSEESMENCKAFVKNEILKSIANSNDK